MLPEVRLRNTIEDLRSEKGPAATIDLPNLELAACSSECDRLSLLRMLHVEYVHGGMSDQVIDLKEQAVDEFPASVAALTDLASYIYYFGGDLERALEAAESAVQLSTARGYWTRNALQTKARILKKLERYDDFEETLKALLSDETPTLRYEIRYEKDVVEGIPPGAVDAQLVSSFLERTHGPVGA